jgi:hypothetical protein
MSGKRHSLRLKEKVEIVNVYNNEKRNHMRKLCGEILYISKMSSLKQIPGKQHYWTILI